jgi:hypothetical protein
MDDSVTLREQVLDEAKNYITADRNTDYGTPESNFTDIARFWSTYLGASIMPHDVAAMMMLMKISRIKTNPDKRDSWTDGAGYAACGFEVAPANIGQ